MYGRKFFKSPVSNVPKCCYWSPAAPPCTSLRPKPHNCPSPRGLARWSSYPYVELSGEEALGDSSGIQAGSGDVHHSHEEEPAHLAHRGGLDEALGDGEVHGGHHAAQAQAQKHACQGRRRAVKEAAATALLWSQTSTVSATSTLGSAVPRRTTAGMCAA